LLINKREWRKRKKGTHEAKTKQPQTKYTNKEYEKILIIGPPTHIHLEKGGKWQVGNGKWGVGNRGSWKNNVRLKRRQTGGRIDQQPAAIFGGWLGEQVSRHCIKQVMG